jgi:hypothetical protein
MSEYTRTTCIVCGGKFSHENHTEETCGLDCDRQLARQKQEQQEQEEQGNE